MASAAKAKFRMKTSLIDLRRLLEGVIFCMHLFGGLGGHCGLQTALEDRSDLRFEISDLDYQHIHVHTAYMVWSFLAASEATMASKQPRRSDLTSDLKFMAQITYANMFVWTDLAFL